jgi:hypothetical protein
MLIPATATIPVEGYTYNNADLWGKEVVEPALVAFVENLGLPVWSHGNAFDNGGRTNLYSSVKQFFPKGGISSIVAYVMAKGGDLAGCEWVNIAVGFGGEGGVYEYVVVNALDHTTDIWRGTYGTAASGHSSSKRNLFQVTLSTVQSSNSIKGCINGSVDASIPCGTLALPTYPGENYTLQLEVEPRTVARKIYNGSTLLYTLAIGEASYVRGCGVGVSFSGLIKASGYDDHAWYAHAESPTHRITMVRAADSPLVRVSIISNVGIVMMQEDGGDPIQLGIGNCTIDVISGWSGTIYILGDAEEDRTHIVGLTEDATVDLTRDDPTNDPDVPDDPSDPLSPLPDPADAENMLIRVHTALAGVVSYNNDGWPSNDITDVATEGVVDIEVSPPNNWPWSLMTGGVLTFQVGGRSYTKRVDFCPNTSLAVYMGPDVVRVIGGSEPQEVFWKPDGLQSWLPGLGTSRGTAEGEVDVEFQVETSGLLSVTRGGTTYQEIVLYHGGTVHEVPYDEVTTKAISGSWGNYGALIPVAVVAILAIVVIMIITR